MAVSGFKPVDLSVLPVMESYNTPTLHVLGRNDVLVVAERSQTLIDVSTNKRVEYHDGGEVDFALPLIYVFSNTSSGTGHFVPSKANWRKFFHDYFLDPLGNVPSPSQSPDSPADTPGTMTPKTEMRL